MRAIVWAGIRATHQVQHLVGLHGRCAGIRRIRPDPGQIIDRKGGDRTVPHNADPAPHDVAAGVDVRRKTLQPIGDEFDRAAQMPADGGRRHLVTIDVDFDPERTADVFAHHADLVLLQAEMQRKQVLHHVRRLRALVDRKPAIALVPIRHQGPRFQRDTRMAREPELRLDHLIGRRQRRIHLPGVDPAFPREVRAQLRMHQRRCGIECVFDIDQRRQGRVVDLDQLQRILRHGAAVGHHHDNRLPLPTHPADGEGMLRRRFQADQMRQRTYPGAAQRRHLRPGQHGYDAGHGARGGGVDRHDFRMRVG